MNTDFSAEEPATFSEYVMQQVGLFLLQGPPLDPAVTGLIPRWLSRMAECEAARASARSERGIHVPSMMFLAVTGRCNLRCPHCYTQQYEKKDMPIPLARRILTQARELGVSLFVISGGEPLLHREFFAIVRDMTEVPFPLFTNGFLAPRFLDDGLASPNLLWLVSVDGPRVLHDARRGAGGFDAAMTAMDALRERRIPFGFSTTLCADNVDAAADPKFLATLIERGCRYGSVQEQIPAPPSNPPLAERIDAAIARCRTELGIPITSFPADEARFGGCQAGGGGLSHVSPDGFLEPCPVARLAADSLADVSLEAALSNPFFKEFRELKDRFTRAQSCSYSGREETFEDALARYGAHSTV